MKMLRMLCIPFSQRSAGREPLALQDLTRLKPLPCPVPWPYQPLHMGPPSLPILWPYQPSHVRPSSSALYSGPTTLSRSGIQTCPCPLPWPYQPSQVSLHCLMIYAFSVPAPFSYFPLSPSPPKGPSSHP